MTRLFQKKLAGQSLIELIIALTVGIILIGTASGAIVLFLRSGSDIKVNQIANSLSLKYTDSLKSFSESNWQDIYNLTGKGPNSQFYIIPSGSTFAVVAGATTIQVEGQTFTLSFALENVNRDSCGIGNITTVASTSCSGGPGTEGIANDPSTQKATIAVGWGTCKSISKTKYLTRSLNYVFIQDDWSGGGSQENFPSVNGFTSVNNKFSDLENIDYASSTGSIFIKKLE